jgi:tetratricopeptide (TPR) repeat protein
MALSARIPLTVLGLLLIALPAAAGDKPDGDKPDKKTEKADKADKADKKPAKGATKGGKADGPDEDKSDPDNVTALSKYMQTVLKGNGKYTARDFPAALDAYRTAIPLAPKNPLGHYLVAETQMAIGNLPEAEASLKQAEAASDDRNAGLRAKILYLTADLKERTKHWDEAKAAWQAYGEYAQKHADVAFPQSGTSRAQAVDEMLKQDKAYEGVRQRIAAEKSGGSGAPAAATPAAPAPASPPAPAKK